MTDVFEQDKARFAGITQGPAIIQKVNLDLQVAAARALEAERQADMRARQEALAHEAALIGEAERAAVEKLSPLKVAYAEREAAARAAVEAIASLWRIEQEIRNGLQLADRALQNVEALIEPTRRAAWRQTLRDRAGLPLRHGYMPDVKPADDAQTIGVTTVRAITAGVIQPGTIVAGRDVVNL